jgi:hypothetical protein
MFIKMKPMKNTWLIAAGLGVVGTAAYLMSQDIIPTDLGISSLVGGKKNNNFQGTNRTNVNSGRNYQNPVE